MKDTNTPTPNQDIGLIYVCYEVNSREIAIENNAIANLYPTFNFESAMKWFKKSREAAKKDGFSETLDEHRGESELRKELQENGSVYYEVYRNGDEDHDNNFAIIIKRFDANAEPE